MSTLMIEHINITVSDSTRTAALYERLFGWHVRWQGPAQNDGYSVHIGTNEHYVALYTHPLSKPPIGGFLKGVPLNHLGIEVDDLDEVERRVLAEGLKTFNHASYDPGRRFYFLDHDGIEYEIISYK